ncbi:MAG: phosphotransferase [Cypionkella sp.]|nr:phosphotransferase [Cypionkella sp.]
MTQRGGDMLRFLAQAGWEGAGIAPLAGDASARRYFRITLGSHTAVLMDTPPDCADDPAQFVTIAAHLASLGLSPPQCLAKDLAHGFLLLEDLGDALFARVVARDPNAEMPLYARAVDVLQILQAHPAPPDLPNLTALDWADAAMLAITRYAAAITLSAPDQTALRDILASAILRHADGPRVLILRDYHAENLLHLPMRAGAAQVGLLDFQLAQLGQPSYDLVSLLQDARRDVAPNVQAAMIQRAAANFGVDFDVFSTSYATFGAQRALRILGIFSQLCITHGKAAYIDLIPRVWGQLQQNLAHPALRDLARACASILPPPNTAALATLRSQCRNFP